MQCYIPKDVAGDALCPFDPGDQATLLVLPGVGFMLVQADALEWPLHVRDPRRVPGDIRPMDVVTTADEQHATTDSGAATDAVANATDQSSMED